MRPTGKMLGFFCGLFVLALVLVIIDQGKFFFPVLMIFCAWVLIDWIVSRRDLAQVSIERELAEVLPVGVPAEIKLYLLHQGLRPLKLEVLDMLPEHFRCENPEVHFDIEGESTAEGFYRATPGNRGPAKFTGLALRTLSRSGLWSLEKQISQPAEVRIFPNYAEIARFAELAAVQRLDQMNIHRSPRRGEGTEFRDIREFRNGDRLSSIDWKVTARYGKIHSRQFHEETDQQVFFLLDCGRNMRARDGLLSHFDAALNSSILLSHVATKQGDSVGLMNFASDKHIFLEKLAGKNAVSQLMNSIYDLHSSLHIADYEESAMMLLSRLKRRTLVLVLSNLHEEESDEMLDFLKRLRTRHLVVFASLKEKALTDRLEKKVECEDSAMKYASALAYQDQRERALETIRQSGILTIDTSPEDLPASLVSKYFEIKAAGNL